jgi:NitT/TauT family transport system substrate-binding protein/putative hydroxymethylpyrimidine transport system substrate-binding protein
MGQGRRLAAAVIGLALLAGCGGSDGSGPQRATLLLDFTPNAVHAGIFTAVARGYDRDAGVRLRVREPSSSADAAKLLAAGRTDFAVLDIHDLGLAREKGADLVGVFALVQRPLASVIAQPGIRTPRALAGRRVGVTGVPSDDAVLRSIVRGAGGDPGHVRTTTIGFNAVPALLARSVDGATAFWNAEGVALRRRRPGFHVFRVDAYGAPAYPELVVTVTGRTLRERRGLVDRLIRALRRGYERAQADPPAAVDELVAASPGLDRSLTAAQLAAVRPAFGRSPGRLDPQRLRAWAAWDVRFGILRRAPDVARAFALS